MSAQLLKYKMQCSFSTAVDLVHHADISSDNMRLFHSLSRTIQRRALGALWSVFLLRTLVAAQNDAWHVDNIWPLATERIDPVVSPNGVSSHMHRIVGGSQFGASYDGKEYEQASCSSASIQADKSNCLW